jgi:hypothetical protein
MLKPPRDAHEAFIGLGPNLKDISSFVSNCRLPPRERQLLADMLLGYFLGLACEYKRVDLRLVRDEESARLRES